MIPPHLEVSVVLRVLAEGRDLAAGSGPWTTRFVRKADIQFGGRWRDIELGAGDVTNIWLPPHAGEPCQGDRGMLVPSGGASLGEAVRRLRTSRAHYAGASPCCWGRITAAMHAPLSPIIVTTEPLDDTEYRSVDSHPDCQLYHLDGLHRLIGWCLADRLTPAVRIRALVAG